MIDKEKTSKSKQLNEFMVSCFYSIWYSEEKALESLTNGKLSLKEIHIIEAVFKAKKKNENNFSTIANILGITMGTLTTAFTKLEKKGYLIKERDKDDKRFYYIEPTRIAELINDEHTAWHERLIAGVIKTLPEKDLENFVSVLENMAGFFKELK